MSSSTYGAAGVDIDAGEEAVARIKGLVESTARPGVVGGIGGFGGMFAFPANKYRSPILVSSTDGVGTKSYVASAMGLFSTIGIDLVAMCVDDLVCAGAEPLFLLDYLAVPHLDPSMVEEIVAGVAAGCRIAGCALIGGEMAEHPPARGGHGHPPARGGHGHPPAGGNESSGAAFAQSGHSGAAFDLAGFAVGAVEADAVLRPESVRAGDELVGIASPGLRCNGYSLARHALLEVTGRSLGEAAWSGADRTLGEELLEPSVIYAPAILALIESVEVHGLAHITGGGIPGNLPRALPGGWGARVDRSAWPVPRLFEEVRRAGEVPEAEMARVFNLGVGMIAVVAAGEGRAAVESLASSGHEAWVIGTVTAGHEGVELV